MGKCLVKFAYCSLLLLALAPRTILANDAAAEHPGVARGVLQGHTDEIISVAIGKDGLIASGSTDKTARLWSTTDGKNGNLLFVLKNTDEVRQVAFSGNGKLLATGGPDAKVVLWDTATGKQIKTLEGMGAPIFKLGVSDDEKIVAAAGGEDGKIWDAETGKVILSFEGKFALSPDGHVLATSAVHAIDLTDVTTGKPMRRLTGHRGYANELAFSPDGKILASGGASQRGIHGDPNDPAQDKLVKLWDIKSGENLTTLEGHENGIGHLMFSPDGKMLVSTDYNGCMRRWDLETKKTVSMLEHVKYGTDVERTPLGFWALDPSLKIWAVGAGDKVLWIDISEFTGNAR